jgi:hypothetical protein
MLLGGSRRHATKPVRGVCVGRLVTHYVLLLAPKPFVVIKPLFGDLSIATVLSFTTMPPSFNPFAFSLAVASALGHRL